jgi:hypothetical protein
MLYSSVSLNGNYTCYVLQRICWRAILYPLMVTLDFGNKPYIIYYERRPKITLRVCYH